MKKHIVLCADDYGQAHCISQGIIDLLAQDRLSAVSCMVNSPGWEAQSAWLVPFKNKADIGLHFNITEGDALSSAWINTYGKSFPSLPTLLRKAFFRLLDPKVVEAECEAQLLCFVEKLGSLPCFIDGHQHVHQFPIIREALVALYRKHFDKSRAYIRLVNENIKWGSRGYIKKAIIYMTGTRALRQLLQKNNIPYNQSFAGIYAFTEAHHYASFFPVFLKNIKEGGLIMCHPGLQDVFDPIAHARIEEYHYFASDAFLKACKEQEIRIGRFRA